MEMFSEPVENWDWDVPDSRRAANSDSMSFVEKVILTFFLWIFFESGSIHRPWISVFTFNVFLCAAQKGGGRTGLPHPESAGSHLLFGGAGDLRAV